MVLANGYQTALSQEQPSMSTWIAVIAASAIAYAFKLAGFAIPSRWLERPFLVVVILAAASAAGLRALSWH